MFSPSNVFYGSSYVYLFYLVFHCAISKNGISSDYIVQGHRYDIFENVGCQAALYISIEAILIIWFPQLLFAVITFIFGALVLHNFIRRRLTFALHLQQSNSALTSSHFLRLIAMALTLMVWGTSLTAFNLYSNVSSGLRPWKSWEDVHSNFSRIAFFPAALLPPQFIQAMTLFWWTIPASSLIFFVFFGFGEETLKGYKKAWRWLMVKAFKRPINGEKGSIFGGSSLRDRFVTFLFSVFVIDRVFFISRAPRILHLVKLTSSSRDYKSTSSPTSASHESHLSRSTITLALKTPISDPSWLKNPITQLPQSKDDEAIAYSQPPSQDPAPAYYTPYPTSYPEVYLASPEHPMTDDADTFTISTFSYYGSAPSPSSASHRFELTNPSPTLGPHGLSPPPVSPIVKRPIPRNVPSSADSIMTDFPSRSSTPVLGPTSVPQDVTEPYPK